jgi:hypothetical protein
MNLRMLLFLYAVALAATYAALKIGEMLYSAEENFVFFAPAHYLGGVAVGVFVHLLGRVLGMRMHAWHCLAAILFIGTAWELWEYALGLAEYPRDLFDTVSDYVMDTAGAFTAFYSLRRWL